MSSAKSRNFRRRGGEEEDDNSATPSSSASVKTNATPSTINKPKKPIAKSLLSFADGEEDEESPIIRPAVKNSSVSRTSTASKSSSAHKLTLSKERVAAPSPSSSLYSNVQPRAGLYTKEAMLELQKNTRSISGSSRLKPKPEAEPAVVLRGLVKPVVTTDGSEANGRSRYSKGTELGFDRKTKNSSVDRQDALARLGKVGLGSDSEEDEGMVMDQKRIEEIKAKRERLRQAKPAAPDFISLDAGSNHGEADGLSDEEPEFRGRIGLFGDKAGDSNKKGVFEQFEDRAMPKDRKIESSDDEDEEDKMWEEEQVRKGLGKRLDDGIGSQGVGVSGLGSSAARQSGTTSSFGFPGATGTYAHTQDMPYGGNSGIGGAVGGLFDDESMPMPQQFELAKKAFHENRRRLKESYDGALSLMAKNEENMTASLVNVTTLENSLAAAGEKFLFVQKFRDFIAVLCEFLEDKAPFIEELEEQIQKLYEKRASAIAERRTADNDDEISEIEPAIAAARAEFRKGGSDAAATAAARAASANADMSKSAPVELDEFGRDVNRQKRMDVTRRAEARRRRRDKSDSKRKLAMDNDNSFQQMEGELSTDESDRENMPYESTRNEILQVAEKIFSDAAVEYSQFHVVIEMMERFKKDYASSYRDAYMSLSIPALFSPYVRLELLKWDPLHENADFNDMKWHSLLFNYGIQEGEDTVDENDADLNLVPDLVEKLAIPILRHQLTSCWDMLSTRETKNAVSSMNLVVTYVDFSSSALGTELLAIIRDRLTNAVADLVVPTWSPVEMNVVPNAARVAAYRFGRSVRLMRNICLWREILAMPVLENIALDNLLYGKVLPHLHSIRSNVSDAISRTERVIASLGGVWAGQSVTGDRSRKLLPLVDYLMLISKTLEKRYSSGAFDPQNSELVRRLRKMLVELNQYDHARKLSKTFNLKEAL